MKQFNYPTTIYFGPGSLIALGLYLRKQNLRHVLIVSDETLVQLGVVDRVIKSLDQPSLKFTIFKDVHPNPIEADVRKGVKAFKDKGCDCLIAVGGGSPMDAAKVIKMASAHDGPLAQYDDAQGGSNLITKAMPALFAVPTTAGTRQ